MSRPHVPPAVLDAAHARRAARIARDWPEADRLRDEIEAAGWRVVDRGNDFSLLPAHPPDVADAGRIRYGSSQSVPSRLTEPDGVRATLVVLALDAGVDRPGPPFVPPLPPVPDELQVLVVADDPEPDLVSEINAAMAAAGSTGQARSEVIVTSARLGPGACLNAALRRAVGSLLVVLGPGTSATGDVVAALERAVSMPDVAAAGADGLTGPDVRHLEPAPPGDVVALDGRCLGVRRQLALRRGPVDEQLRTWPYLASWWTLVLRDEGTGRSPLRARHLPDLPIATTPAGSPARVGDPDRLVRRDRYRLLDRFGSRPELFTPRRPD